MRKIPYGKSTSKSYWGKTVTGAKHHRYKVKVLPKNEKGRNIDMATIKYAMKSGKRYTSASYPNSKSYVMYRRGKGSRKYKK